MSIESVFDARTIHVDRVVTERDEHGQIKRVTETIQRGTSPDTSPDALEGAIGKLVSATTALMERCRKDRAQLDIAERAVLTSTRPGSPS